MAKCDQCKTIITTSGYVTRREIGKLFCSVPCCNKNRLLSRLRAEPDQSVVCFNEGCEETIGLEGAGSSGAVAVGGKKNGGLYCPRCAAAKDKAMKKAKATKAKAKKNTAEAKAKAKATKANTDAANLKAYGPCGADTRRGQCGHPALSEGGLCRDHRDQAKKKDKATKANRDAANLKAYGICGKVTRRGKCGHPALSMGGLCTDHRNNAKKKMKKRRKM